MIEQTMRFKVLILPLALTLTVVLLVFFVKPAFSDMMQAKNGLEQNQAALANVQAKNQKLQNLKSQWSSLMEDRSLVETALPDSEDVDAFIAEIVSKANLSGVLVSQIDKDQQIQSTSSAYICKGGEDATDASMSDDGTYSEDNALAVSSSCVDPLPINLSVRGSWEQVLELLKYVEDMNRIVNINLINFALSMDSDQEQSSDLLTASIGFDGFLKKKDDSTGSVSAENLASQGKFNENALNKLKNSIYAPFSAPSVSSGEVRNIFK
ncbi:MAG: type 4a pilus biogenesis protein PilO [Candidatus Moranbacteria bacterium]|nr:type 4a pilus biogenesis protein PilO [Candidatus Moranbacteria bacterium]